MQEFKVILFWSSLNVNLTVANNATELQTSSGIGDSGAVRHLVGTVLNSEPLNFEPFLCKVTVPDS